jgi:pyrroloquinoline quinone biosynthesis protein E
MFKLADSAETSVQEQWEAYRASLSALPGPVHVPDRSAYDREVEQRLASDARCRENWNLYQASFRRSAVPDFLPVRLDIENVSRCNFKCGMCQVSAWDKLKRANDMTVDFFKRLIDEQYGLVEIKLHGMGEPLLGGGDFFEMVRYARQRHIWVRTVTNASTLHQRDGCKTLIDTGINEVQISMHGATPEVFKAITGRDQFDRVAANCKLINAHCDHLGVMRTKMWTVVQRQNAHQLSTLVDLAADLGFKTQVFALDLNDWGQDRWIEENKKRMLGTAFDVELGHALVEQGRRLGVRVAFWMSSTVYDTATPDTLCPWPFAWAYITSDQRAVPCAMLANPDHFEIGTRTESFGATWASDEYRRFRQEHLDGKIPSVCQGCYRARAIKGALDIKRVAAAALSSDSHR